MDFICDPAVVLNLPLFQLEGKSFESRDACGHLCTVTGAVWRPDGRYFDGVNDYINCGHSPHFDITDNLTMEAWINMAELFSDNRAVLRKGGSYVIDVSYSKIRFFIFDDGASNLIVEIPQTPDMVDRWMHVVGTYRGRVLTLYINGIQADQVTTTGGDGSIEVTTDDGTVGSWGTGSCFKGGISLIRICNRALSSQEIQNRFDYEKRLFRLW